MDEDLKREYEGIELARKLLLRKKTKEAEEVMNLILDGEPPDKEVYLEIFRNYHEFALLKNARAVIDLYRNRTGKELLDGVEKDDFESDEKAVEAGGGSDGKAGSIAPKGGYYNGIFIALMISGIASLMMFEYEHNAIFVYGFKYLYLPLFVFVFISSRKYGLPLGGSVFGSKTLLVALVAAVLTIFAGPAAGLVNAFVGKQSKTGGYYVADRREAGGGRFYLVLKDRQDVKTGLWQVGREVYDRHKAGDKPDFEIMTGSLGIRYIKR